MPELRPQIYLDDRPAERLRRFHERARRREPDWVYTLARILLTPLSGTYGHQRRDHALVKR
jgi:hypothetical protein